MLRARTDRSSLAQRYGDVRAASERLCQPLVTEDYVVQSMPDVSPTKWHLAHASWFFETFVLKPYLPGYQSVDDAFAYLFNSYYNSVGDQYPRPRRGLVTRPTVEAVFNYRRHVDEQLNRLLERDHALPPGLEEIIELGLHHEQQHQELLLMDIKHVLSCNPLFPAYIERPAVRQEGLAPAMEWIHHPEGLNRIGHADADFSFDNERPEHRVFLPAFGLASRPVSNAEYLDFINAGGYGDAGLWLADGWTQVRSEGWEAPLYWFRRDGSWAEFTLAGLRPLDPNAPVCHVSYFEADALATWAGARLPTEAEWEVSARELPLQGNFVESGVLHPLAPPRPAPATPVQMFGDVWEWTQSAYAPYPGFRKAEGALGEYNGKFMCNQFVLRGGCCVTPASHIRATYRNFFYPHTRWHFSGIRLARDA